MEFLKQSTAATVKLGPFVDEDDGKTAETGLTISQADIRLSKNGGNMAQTNNAAGATHDEIGFYGVPLDTTDTNTLGRLKVMVHEAGALPVWETFHVLPANVYDSLFSTDKLEVDVTQIGGDTQSGTDLKDFADAGYDPGTNKVQGVVLVDTLTTYTGNTVQTGDNFARLGAPTNATIAADIAAVKADTESIETDTQDLQTQIGTAGAGLTDLGGMSTGMKAEVESEVNDALDTSISELGVGAPTATPTIRTALMLPYMALRNKTVVQTSGVDALEIHNDAGTKIASKLLTDDGSDYTEAEMA